jgi:hypothetical protein
VRRDSGKNYRKLFHRPVEKIVPHRPPGLSELITGWTLSTGKEIQKDDEHPTYEALFR